MFSDKIISGRALGTYLVAGVCLVSKPPANREPAECLIIVTLLLCSRVWACCTCTVAFSDAVRRSPKRRCFGERAWRSGIAELRIRFVHTGTAAAPAIRTYVRIEKVPLFQMK